MTETLIQFTSGDVIALVDFCTKKPFKRSRDLYNYPKTTEKKVAWNVGILVGEAWQINYRVNGKKRRFANLCGWGLFLHWIGLGAFCASRRTTLN